MNSVKKSILLILISLLLLGCASVKKSHDINFTLIYYPGGEFTGGVYRCQGTLLTEGLATYPGVWQGIIKDIRPAKGRGLFPAITLREGWYALQSDGWNIFAQGWGLDGENTISVVTPSTRSIESLMNDVVREKYKGSDFSGPG